MLGRCSALLISAFNVSFEARHQWFTHVILATWEAEIGRIKVQGQPGQIIPETPISKITRTKWTGDVAQAIELLLCKCKALNSKTPVPTTPPKRDSFDESKQKLGAA
jgi:hypothetical protein